MTSASEICVCKHPLLRHDRGTGYFCDDCNCGEFVACSPESKREDREALKQKTSREDKMERRLTDLVCAYCPPNGGENAKRKPKHGKAKRKK